MPLLRLVARLRLIALFGLAVFIAESGPAGASTAFSTLYDFQAGSDGMLPYAGRSSTPPARSAARQN